MYHFEMELKIKATRPKKDHTRSAT